MTSLIVQLRSRTRALPFGAAAVAYLVVVTVAELFTAYGRPMLGMTVHCLTLLALLYHSYRAPSTAAQRFLVSMTMAPLIRVVSLALPIAGFPRIYGYLIVSLPLFAAVWAAARALDLSWRALGLNLQQWPLQILVGLTGIGFGIVEYLILRPEPLVETFAFQALWGPALILLVSIGLLEEMIFRGLLQRTGREALGRWYLLYLSLLFAVLHIGYRSLIDFLFVLAVGLFLGTVVRVTGSLLGVALAHGLTNIVLFLVMPFTPLANTSEGLVQPMTIRRSMSPIRSALMRAIPVSAARPTATPAPTAPASTAISMSIAPQVPNRSYARVTATRVNLRAGPGLDRPVLGMVKSPQELLVLARMESTPWWAVCCLEEATGWLAGSTISISGEVDSVPLVRTAPYVTVRAAATDCRAGPGKDHPTLGHAYAGETLSIVGQDTTQTWWHVCCVQGTVGWVDGHAVQPAGEWDYLLAE